MSSSSSLKAPRDLPARQTPRDLPARQTPRDLPARQTPRDQLARRASTTIASILGAALFAALPLTSHAAGSAFGPVRGFTEPGLLSETPSAPAKIPGLRFAQAEGDDSYDPFADYSEFEESMDEEEDINFFRNGRLFTLGFSGGYRGWTETLGKIYSGSPTFGVFLSYFFDLRFAMQAGFLISDHTLVVKGNNFAPIQGTVNVSDMTLLLKYYLNTQNVTRGLADLNPYLVGGFSQLYRTVSVNGSDTFAKDSAFGFNIGAGIEIPMLRNKMFFGLQANYQLVNFADEAKVINDENDQPTGITPRGDSYLVLGVLGVNF